ncbi:MAG: hypothetical protein H6741_19435 [Alphaproteobacteria bacterium]|nr:hypothetical protein [Alphaproteobacteria bacterium]
MLDKPPEAPEAALRAATLEALRPKGLERLQVRLTGGFAVTQLLERLPAPLRAALQGASDNPVLARREALDRLTWVLDALIQDGQVQRRRARLKNALVDVYRLSGSRIRT